MKHLNILCLLLFLCSCFTQAQIENVGSEEYGRLLDVQYHPDEESRLYAITYGNHIVTSDNNGESWSILYSFPETVSLKGLRNISNDTLGFFAENGIYFLNLNTLEISFEAELPVPTNSDSHRVISFDVYPDDSDYIIAAQGYQIGMSNFKKAYYTSNGGEEWQEIYYDVDHDNIALNSVAINPSDSTQLYLFRGNSPENVIGGLLISDDAGETWEEKLAGYTLKAFDFNPDNPQELLVGTYIGFGDHEEKLFKSTDAGSSWDSIPINWTDKTLNNITNITYKPDDPNTVIVLEENEIVVTEDGFDTWENYVYSEVDVHSYSDGLFTSFNPFQEGEVYITANYHILHSDNNAEDLEWAKNPYFNVTGGISNIYQEGEIEHLYYGVQYGFVHKDLNTDEEDPYFVKPINHFSNALGTDLHIDKNTEGKIYFFDEVFSNSQLYFSSEHGDNETAIYTTFKTRFDAITSFPSDDNVILASFSFAQGEQPDLVKIDYTDLEAIETEELNIPTNKWISGVYINEENETITISSGIAIYKSYDQGETWQEFNEGLEDLESGNHAIYDLDVNPLNEDQLTIATTEGIFTSYDQGETWEKLKNGRFNKVEHSTIENEHIIATRYSWEDMYNAYDFEIYYTDDLGENWEEISNEDMYYIQAYTASTLFNEDGETADVYIGTSDIGVIKLTLDFTDLSVPDYSDDNNEKNILIYPNPAEDFLHIETKNNIDISRLSFYAMNGKKIKEEGSSNKIDVSSMPSGVYLLKIQTNSNEKVIKRFVKK